MEPKSQVEIQLGHMCNNRCVFCVSGQRTGLRQAFPLAVQPMLDRVTEARNQGHDKLTLLGGEPTLQPGFMAVVEHAVQLGFSEIVIFTNGVKTARASFIDEVLATGGNFTWRISIQGADKSTHEVTTKKPQSFDRIVKTMEHLRERDQRITINMCVVESNYRSVHKFPELCRPFGIEQLHLDLMRPLDSGDRTVEELRGMMPKHTDTVTPLTQMIQGFPDGFDVNVGNFPFCVAPDLAPWIHHDGEQTWTVAIDGDDRLSEPWNKYEVKRRDKVKPARCGECLFNDRCSGVFETYEKFYGLDELVPVTPEVLAQADPEMRLFPVHMKPLMDAVRTLSVKGDFSHVTAVESADDEVMITFEGQDPVGIALRRPAAGAVAGFGRFALFLRRGAKDLKRTEFALTTLWNHLVAQGHRVEHPLGDDAVQSTTRSIKARLHRLRARAPFGNLEWSGVKLEDGGRRANLVLESPEGARVIFWIAERNGQPSGGYRLESGEASPTLVEGLAAMRGALRGAT